MQYGMRNDATVNCERGRHEMTNRTDRRKKEGRPKDSTLSGVFLLVVAVKTGGKRFFWEGNGASEHFSVKRFYAAWLAGLKDFLHQLVEISIQINVNILNIS